MDVMEFLRRMERGIDPVPEAIQDGMSESDLKAILQQLEGLGYIEKIGSGDVCSSCERRWTCAGSGTGISLYSITSKGRRAAQGE